MNHINKMNQLIFVEAIAQYLKSNNTSIIVQGDNGYIVLEPSVDETQHVMRRIVPGLNKDYSCIVKTSDLQEKNIVYINLLDLMLPINSDNVPLFNPKSINVYHAKQLISTTNWQNQM